MWEISFVPLEWCSENKNEYISQTVTAVSCCTIFGCTSNMEILGKLFVLVNEISRGKKKRGGCFFILLCVFFHLRSKFGGPSSALVSTVGNFVCWLVCSHYYSNANEFVASPSCSKSLKCRQNVLPGQGMLCCACRVPQGDVGVPPSQRSCTAGPEGNALLWVKERR